MGAGIRFCALVLHTQIVTLGFDPRALHLLFSDLLVAPESTELSGQTHTCQTILVTMTIIRRTAHHGP